MKKQYIAAVACLMAGAIGFIGVYANNLGQQKKQVAQEVEQQEEIKNDKPAQVAETSNVVKPKQQDKPQEIQEEKETEATEVEEEKTVEETVAKVQLHFSADKAVSPMKGEIILPYSMDKTIYFPTLDQYKYNPALVVKGDVDSKVVFMAKGNITNIDTNEETGCTITQDIGDGYTAIYGQLKDITVKVGDSVEGNELAGYISAPTKYYSLEGSNLYFQLLKDGVPVDPTEYVTK